MESYIKALIQLIPVPLTCTALGIAVHIWISHGRPRWMLGFIVSILALLAQRLSSFYAPPENAIAPAFIDALLVPTVIILGLIYGLWGLHQWLMETTATKRAEQ